MTLLRRSLFVLILVCLGCSAQSAPPDVARIVERQVRSYYSLNPETKVVVGAIRPSEFPNYDAITVTLDNGGKKNYEFLLAKDRKTLIRMTRLDLTKDPFDETMKKIDVNGRPTRGNKNAKVVVVNYDDFECPFCSRMHQTLFPQLFNEYGDRILFIYKDYPLAEIHPWATHAAVNANCLAAQNNDAYWEFADYLHNNQRAISGPLNNQLAELDRLALIQGQKHSADLAKLGACIKAQDDSAVKASVKEGDALGVSATPTMYVNGQKVDGAVPIEELRAVFDGMLQDAGVAIPEHKPTTIDAGKPAPKPSM